jgi:hypothetical protein
MAIDIRQSLSLDLKQRQRLKELVQSDASAQQRWLQLQSQAEARLAYRPHPLAVIHFEGLLNTNPDRIASTSCLMDMDDLAVLNDAYAVSGQERYALAVRDYVLAWTQTYLPTGNPINERMLEAVLVGYDLLGERWNSSETAIIEDWMKRMADLEIQSGIDRPRSTTNNWHTKRLSIVGTIGVICRLPENIAYAHAGYQAYLAASLFPDGSSVDFHQRDALSYHQSGLKPLVVLARTLQQVGLELWPYHAASGASTARSIDWLIPYVDGSQVHAEWVNTQSKLDRQRAEAGIDFYQTGKPYDPLNALELFELASYFDPRYLNVVRLLTHNSDRYPTWLAVVCAV